MSLLALLASVTPMVGQSAVIPDNDPRVAIIHALPGSPVSIQTIMSGDVLIMLPFGERIQRIVLSVPGAYQIRASAAADALSIRQLRGVSQATMAIETDQRHYDVSLVPTSDINVPYIVRIEHADTGPAVRSTSPPPSGLTSYKLSGTTALRPRSIGDDGLHTYITWSDSQLIPAAFAIDTAGHEQTVDGYMRDGVFTIDRVYAKLVFRIDRLAVFATRQPKSDRRHGS